MSLDVEYLKQKIRELEKTLARAEILLADLRIHLYCCLKQQDIEKNEEEARNQILSQEADEEC